MVKKKVAIYKRTVFWQMLQKSLALFSGPAMFTLHEFKAGTVLMIIAGIIGTSAALISIWFVDNDNNGIVDLFEWGNDDQST